MSDPFTIDQQKEALNDLEGIFKSLDDVHEAYLELCMGFAKKVSSEEVEELARKLARKLTYTFTLGEAAEDKLEKSCKNHIS